MDKTTRYPVEDGSEESKSIEDWEAEEFKEATGKMRPMWRVFKSTVVTDDAGIFYFLIETREGKKFWMPLRTD